MEMWEQFAGSLRVGLMALAVVAFAAIVAWTLLRPQKRIDADAQLWKEE